MLSIIFGYSKYYVDNLSENVKRGNRTKCEKGWRPNKAPIGYFNDPSTKTVVPDPERFLLVRKLFDMALMGTYSIRELTIESRKWGLTSRPSRRIGGKLLTTSMVYHLLTNPFYSGVFLWNGAAYQGSHDLMITRAEFDRVQTHLKRPLTHAPEKHTFPYTGLMRCGECGMAITAEVKTKKSGRRYTYYHCTRKRWDYRCRQTPITGQKLEQQFAELVSRFSIDQETYTLIRRGLERKAHTRRAELEKQKATLSGYLDDVDRQAANLTTLKVKDLVTDTEYLKERERLVNERLKATEALKSIQTPDNWIEPVATANEACRRLYSWFQVSNAQQKRQIVTAVGSNPLLIDKRVIWDSVIPLRGGQKTLECPNQLAVLDSIRTLHAHGKLDAILAKIRALQERFSSRRTAEA